jgi:predicted DNA-binding protein with PD1-like motif
MESKKITDGYLVRCDIDDEVVSALTKFAADNKISSGTVIGIGALKDIVLGYFDLAKKEYLRKEFYGIYELLSLSGNFARMDSEIVLHCHAVISDSEFNVIGGHLFSGLIAVTGEFYVRPGKVEITRERNELTGLNLIKI